MCDSASHPQTLNDRPEGTAFHILVVDDDPRIRQMLIRYFEQEGYRVSVAEDGAAMRAQLSAKPSLTSYCSMSSCRARTD